MKGFILLAIFKLLLLTEERGSQSKWVRFGQLAVCISQAQSSATRHFLASCYMSNMFLSPVFGINFYSIGANHIGCLRILLLVAGDVEQNPGPVNSDKVQDSEPSSSVDAGAVNQLQCSECRTTFKQQKNLNSHMRNVHGEKRHRCVHEHCSFTSAHSSSLKRHITSHKDIPTKRQKLLQATKSIEQDVEGVVQDLVDRVEKKVRQKFSKDSTAFNNRLQVSQIPGKFADPLLFLTESEQEVKDKVEAALVEKTGVKVQLMLAVKFFKPTKPDETSKAYFWSKQLSTYRGTDYSFADQVTQILKKIEEYQREGSGWVVCETVCLEVHLAKCQPLRGSTFGKLPSYLLSKKAIVNVKNDDEKCFLWAILAGLHPTKMHPERVEKYLPYQEELNMVGMEYPVEVRSIDKFERQNDLAINVYGYDEHIYPLRISKVQDKRHFHLLLYKGHYSLIKNLDRLLHDQRKQQHRMFYCPRCLIPNTTRELLTKHMKLCSSKDPTRITMPEEPVLKFKNVHRQIRQPLVVYADFECLLTKIPNQECEDGATTSSTKTQHHEPCGYGLMETRNCCGTPSFKDPTIYRGPNTVERFLTDVVGIAVEHQNDMNNQKEMGNIDEEQQKSDKCHICGDTIEKDKVRDHCHLCGRYRGPAHRECNSGYRLNRDNVVVFHNLRKYDGHLIMQKLGACAKLHGYDIDVVAKAMEDYISFSLVHKREQEPGGHKDYGYKIRFIDSVQFLNNSLAGLVKNMDKNQFHSMRTQFDDEELNLLLRKGVYPYDYMDSWKKFEAGLPSKEQFHNILNNEDISDADYTHAKKVWHHFGHRNMGDYHDLYLKTDILLLADVFESFRRFCLDKYDLDPCHYLTTPSLAWDACLKMTKVELQLLDDVDMYLFCENGIRGGISMISHRYAVANNPMVPSYDPNKPHSHIMYWDANNLYGWAMVQKLPVDGFRWIKDSELDQDWKNINTDGDKGYILEVDLEYPAELHDAHDKYPLAPESVTITDESPYCTYLKELLGIKIPPQKKLVPSLMGRKNYIVHYRNLQFYLQMGMKLVKVHRGLQFNQRAWMEPYIMFNTRLRAQAVSDFDKNLLKLFNNAVFGKTMENVRKYKNIELITSESLFEKRVANHRYDRSCRFNESLVGVAMLRSSTCLCKPIYCGLAVLDLSKELMYRFNYEYIVPKYGSQATLLFTDTDSLCYLIETDDIYKDMAEDVDRFDFSDYPKEHFLHSTTNKKVIGKMKDELSGVPIQAFCGLRPKMYALLPEKKRAKGIKKNVVEKDITFGDYVDTLFNESYMQHSMTMIRSSKHDVYTETISKKGLCAYDDKRWLLDKISSRSRGHYRNSK